MKHIRKALRNRCRYQSLNRRNAIFLALAIFVFLSLGIVKTLGFFKTTISANREENVFEDYQWDGKARLNLLILGDPVILLAYTPTDGSLITLEIPTDTVLNVGEGFGLYKIGSIYNLGQLENQKKGADLTAKALMDYLGMPLDGYVMLKGGQDDKEGSLAGKLREEAKDPFWLSRSALNLSNSIETNLTRLDLSRVLWALAWTRFDKVKHFKLKVGEELARTRQMDGSYEYRFNQASTDKIIREYFQDEAIIKERLRIVVKNSTNHAGLGAIVARRLMNAGVNVVAVENASKVNENTKIIGAPSYTNLRIRQLMRQSCQASDLRQEYSCGYNSNTVDPRADIIVEVGEDEWRRIQ